jgi:nucleolar complex protein 2
MGKTKSTKHFEKNHLKDALKRRKEGAKIKQRHQVKEKLKARKARDNEREDAEPPKPEKKDMSGEQFKNMSVDEFFQGGFEIPDELPKKKSKKSKDAPTATGKRKRTEAKEAASGDDNESSEDDVEEFPISDASASEAESESDEEDYEKTLEALKTNDPKLYAQLQKEDEALFNSNFKEVEELSEDEDEETPKKKRKTSKGKSKPEPESEDSEDEIEGDGNEVTKAMVDKWEKAMSEQHSLRAMKEVVLAFRAAAHLNEEDGKQYKYSVSNPDGMTSCIYSDDLVLTTL